MPLRTLHSNSTFARCPMLSAPLVYPPQITAATTPHRMARRNPTHNITYPMVYCVLDVVQPSHAESWGQKALRSLLLPLSSCLTLL